MSCIHTKLTRCVYRLEDKREIGSIQIPIIGRPFTSHSTFILLGTFLILTLLLVTPQRAFAHGSETHDGVTSQRATMEMLVDSDDTLGDVHHSNSMTPDHHENGLANLNDNSSVTPQDAPHDHSAHAPSNEMLETAFGRFLFWLGKFHPAAVHFPIAMLLGAAFAEIAAFRFNTNFLRDAARFCLWLGALGAVGSTALGWLYGGLQLTDTDSTLALHRWNGTSVALLSLVTLWLAERRLSGPYMWLGTYRTALFVTALLVGLNGYWGSVMVYGPEQHQWPEIPSAHSH